MFFKAKDILVLLHCCKVGVTTDMQPTFGAYTVVTKLQIHFAQLFPEKGEYFRSVDLDVYVHLVLSDLPALTTWSLFAVMPWLTDGSSRSLSHLLAPNIRKAYGEDMILAREQACFDHYLERHPAFRETQQQIHDLQTAQGRIAGCASHK